MISYATAYEWMFRAMGIVWVLAALLFSIHSYRFDRKASSSTGFLGRFALCVMLWPIFMVLDMD